VLERVAKKYHVGISTYFGEEYFTLWGEPVAMKKTKLLEHLAAAKHDRVNLVEVHVAERTPEMEAIFDQNAPEQNGADGTPMVVAHRSAELATMLSLELAELVRSKQIRLVTYAQLMERVGGPSGIHRPARSER
jgi:hypothetical protein